MRLEKRLLSNHKDHNHIDIVQEPKEDELTKGVTDINDYDVVIVGKFFCL